MRAGQAAWQREIDVFQCRGWLYKARVQVESRFTFLFVFFFAVEVEEVYAEHSVLEVAEEYFWNACLRLERQKKVS